MHHQHATYSTNIPTIILYAPIISNVDETLSQIASQTPLHRCRSLVNHPQTDVAPILFEPQTPLPVPQVPMEGVLESFWLFAFEFDD